MDQLQPNAAPSNQNVQPIQPRPKELDFTYFVFFFLRIWPWMLLGLLLGLFGAWVKLRYSTTIYQVMGTVLIEDQKQRSLSEEAVTSQLGIMPESNVENELQILKSSSLMKRVIDSLQLNITYTQQGRIKDSEMYPNAGIRVASSEPLERAYGSRLSLQLLGSGDEFVLLRGDQDTVVCRFGTPFVHNLVTYVIEKTAVELPTGAQINIRVAHPSNTADGYAKKLAIQQVGRSTVLSVMLKDPVPQKAIDIISRLIQEYNNSLIENKNESGRQTLRFIDERLGYITRELYDVERDAENYKRSSDLPIAIAEKAKSYLDRVTTTDEQLMELELRLGMVDNIEVQLNDNSNRYRSLPVSSEILNNSGLVGQIDRYNGLLLEREKLATAKGANPALGAFDKQLEEVRGTVVQSVAIIRRELTTRRNTIRQRLKPIERQINAIPTNERELLQIMRQQQIKEQLFLFLLQKREETALKVAAEVANSRALDPPVNQGPISPNRNRIFLLAVFLGLAIPASLLFAFDFFNTRIYTEGDIMRFTGMPFLGYIGQSSNENPIVVRRGSRSAIAEAFRLLRTNLQFLAAGNKNQIILVTSSISSEGKSFISINLGLSQALAGKKTLLLGLDIRKPKLSRYLIGEQATSGVTNFLAADTPLQQLIRPVPDQENLDFLDCGPVPPNPAELLMSGQTKALFAYLREHYDCVVVDTAPVGLVTDALLLSALVDQSVVVTRFGRTRTSFLRMLEDIYLNHKLPQPGIILNGVRSGRGYGYGYGGYGSGYGYGSDYGYGYYDEEQKKKKFWSLGLLGGKRKRRK
jgi:capsular exopolysaccharide synthesis family protein